MLYFFNIIEGSAEISDPEGTDLPSWEAAQAEAAAVVKDLHREFPERFGYGAVLEVVTACGRRVMALPFGKPVPASLQAGTATGDFACPNRGTGAV